MSIARRRSVRTAALGFAVVIPAFTLLGGTGGPSKNPVTPTAAARPQGTIRYGRDVRPILSDRCFLCHGTDAAKRAANLRLDSFADATRDLGDGFAAIVPGDPDASMLFERITANDPHDIMPPPEANKPALTAAEIETIRRWIADGAEYEPHWAFQSPTAPTVPDLADDDWSRTDVDRFVLRGLRDAGLEPNPEADPATLCRRAFLDLTGLPPTPEELDAFIADAGDDAFERLVDRLMTAEPYRSRYAERMATPWLDLARYADTAGIHMDAGKQMWPYRDWVLKAFRENMPFDRFTIDQLAGDLVPEPTLDQLVASGFHRNHVTSDEGGAIADEYLLEYAVDRVETTGAVWLGLTVGCARCHDHKFDPITQNDFYGMIAFFNNVEQPGIYTQVPDANRAFEPFIEIPRPEDQDRVAAIDTEIAEVETARATPTTEETAAIESYLAGLRDGGGLEWRLPTATAVASERGASMQILNDGSVLATGENPGADHHVVTWRLDGDDRVDAFLLEAMPHETLPAGGVGRAPNGNAILSGITIEAVSIADPSQRTEIPLVWAWADYEQPNGDFKAVNALRAEDGRVWAPQGYDIPGTRALVFLANEPVGFDGGTDLVVRTSYESPYTQHVLGRTRLQVGRTTDAIRDTLPIAASNWYITGPFAISSGPEGYDTTFGPETSTGLDFKARFRTAEDGTGGDAWRYAAGVIDGRTVNLAQGIGAEFVAREIWSPSDRRVSISIGSDDGVQIFLEGDKVFERRVARGVAPDQDSTVLALKRGRNTLVYKIVNTGGAGGMYFRADEAAGTLPKPAVAALLPKASLRPAVLAEADESLRVRISPRYRELGERATALAAERAQILANVPKTSVMRERAMARPTYVMKRGRYDDPDENRPVARTVPAVLGSLPSDIESPNRLDLARWIVGPDNPLTSRVIVNRLWGQLVGRGIVESIEDFGYQSAWPSHPDLLDHLAVSFRDGGWDLQAIIREIMTSSTYRQSARIRPEASEVDPGNHLLASFPRQRLEAEQIRDQALYAADLLIEDFGGPSVKPYQPEGLWREVAMVQSNTRNYEQGYGDDLHRRSVYTYWKRACPPPSLLAFDAPTREYCNVRRLATNTPLQALVLWNDPQFVEASRMLAARVLTELPQAEDTARLDRMFRVVTGHPVPDSIRPAAVETLAAFRARYDADRAAAESLVMVGDVPTPTQIDPAELAAWTMIANAVMSSDAAIVKD